MIYRHIAIKFDQERPFYGIRFNADAVKWKHPLTFEQVAHFYIKDVRSIQPEGPYILAGQCVGGIIAYEMACQLQEAGQQISLLAMYDPIIPRTETARSMKNKLIRNIEELMNTGIRQYAAVKKIYYRNPLQSALYRKTPDALKPFAFHFIKKEAWIKYARSVYKIKPYKGDIIYFDPDEDSGELSERSITIWTQFEMNIRIIPLKGRHDSVF